MAKFNIKTNNEAIDGYVEYSEDNISIANNRSRVNVTAYLHRNNGYSGTATRAQGCTATININGTNHQVSLGEKTVPNGGTYIQVGSWSNNVTHNTDGNKTITVSYTLTNTQGTSGLTVNKISKSISLSKIPQFPVITTAPDFTDAQNPTIKFSNETGSKASKVEVGIYSTDGRTAYCAYRNLPTKTNTSYTFTLTETEKSKLRRAAGTGNTLPIKYYIHTVVDEGATSSESRTSKAASFYIANPDIIITADVVDVNPTTIALTNDEDTIVKGFSTAHFTSTATPVEGATVTEQNCQNDTNKIEGASGDFLNAISETFRFYAQDSRGNTKIEYVSKTFVNYIPLTAVYTANLDLDGNANININGNYFNSTFGEATGAQQNTLSVEYAFKEYDGEYGDWISADYTLNENTYTADIVKTGLEYNKTYVFKIRVSDKLMVVESDEKTISAIPTFDWDNEGFAFNVPVTVQGNAIPKVWTGAISMTPTKVGTVKYRTLYFPEGFFTAEPLVIVTPCTNNPGKVMASVENIEPGSCSICLVKNDDTSSVYVNVLAIQSDNFEIIE